MPLTVIIQIILLIPWTEIIMLIIQMIQDREKEKISRRASEFRTNDDCREYNIEHLMKQYPDMPESRLRWMHDMCYDFLTQCKQIGKDWKQVFDEYLSQFGFDHQVIYEPDFDFMMLYR